MEIVVYPELAYPTRNISAFRGKIFTFVLCLPPVYVCVWGVGGGG